MDAKNLPEKRLSRKEKLKQEIAKVKNESHLKVLRIKKQINLQKIVLKAAVRREKQRSAKKEKELMGIIDSAKTEMEKMSKQVEKLFAIVLSSGFHKVREAVRAQIKQEKLKKKEKKLRQLEMISHQNELIMSLPYMKELRDCLKIHNDVAKEMREKEEKAWEQQKNAIIGLAQEWKKECEAKKQKLEDEERAKLKLENPSESDSGMDFPDESQYTENVNKIQEELELYLRSSKEVVKPSKGTNKIRRSYEKAEKEVETGRRYSAGSLKRPFEPSSEEETWIGKRVRFDKNTSIRELTPESFGSDFLREIDPLYHTENTQKVVYEKPSVSSNASTSKSNSQMSLVTSKASMTAIPKPPALPNVPIASSSKVDLNTPSTSKTASPKANAQPTSPKSPVFKIPTLPPPKKGILKKNKPSVIVPKLQKLGQLQQKPVANTPPPNTRGQLRRTRSARDLGSVLKARETQREKSPELDDIIIVTNPKRKPAMLKPKRVKRFPLKPLEPREPIVTRQSPVLLQKSNSKGNIEANLAATPKTPDKKGTIETKKSPSRSPARIQKENDIMTRRRERSPSPLADTDSASSDDEMNPKKVSTNFLDDNNDDDDFRSFQSSFTFDNSNTPDGDFEPVDLDFHREGHLGNTPDFLK